MEEEKIRKYKIGIIGPWDLVAGFKAFDFEIFSTQEVEEILEIIKKIRQDLINKNGNIALLIITEDLYQKLPEEEKIKFLNEVLPTILVMPGLSKKTGAGLEKLKKLTEKAIGVDIGD